MKQDHRKIASLDCTIVDSAGCDDEIRAIVVLCHGFGASGTDLVPVAAELIHQGRGRFDGIRMVFPAAPMQIDSNGYSDSRAWWPIDMLRIQEMMEKGELRDLRRDRPPLLDERFEHVAGLLMELERETGLGNERIVLGGFSQGAMLATEVALRIKPSLGGLIVWSGTLLAEDQWRAWARNCVELPIVQTHGRIDPILPFAGAELLKEMFEDAGLDVRFAAFDGPHTIPRNGIEMAAQMIADVAG